jgi:hypothetical protein
MDEKILWAAAGEIPPEWYCGDWDALEQLIEILLARRRLVRELITAFRVSSRRPFPNWLEDA